MATAALLAAAMVLDALFGEPDWLWRRVPHPAVLMGRAVGWADDRFNRGTHRRRKGTLVFAGLALAAAAVGAVISDLPDFGILEMLVLAVLLAQRSLAAHVADVAAELRVSQAAARIAVARIVGRDTREMDPPAISRAAIESAAENLSDGVVAPALWYLFFGLPGLLFYKLTNTADSMIGYRTPRHEAFGWAAARTDDLANWIPARVTAGLLWIALYPRCRWAVVLRDARLHRSPNAGWPEAAMASGLGIALSGPRSYEGTRRDYPFVNAEGRHDAGPGDIDRAVATLWKAWGLLLALVIVTAPI